MSKNIYYVCKTKLHNILKILKVMKQTRAMTMNSPKNQFHKNTQIKSQIKDTNVISPRASERNKFTHAVGSKISNAKQQKCGQSQLKKANLPQINVDSLISQPFQGEPSHLQAQSMIKKPQKHQKGHDKKEPLPTSPKNFNTMSSKLSQPRAISSVHENSAALKQQEIVFENKIRELEERVEGFEGEVHEKQKTISQLQTEKDQLINKYEKLNEVVKENKKALRQRVMKFNEESDQIRKLKERIEELENQVKMSKQQKEQKTLTNSCDGEENIRTEESQIQEHWTSRLELTDSYMGKMLQSKICSSTDKSLNKSESTVKNLMEVSEESDGKLSEIILNQGEKIKEQDQTIKSLELKLSQLSQASALQSELDALKQENLNLRKKLVSSLQEKYEKKSVNINKKHKQQLISSLDKILSVSNQNSKMMRELLITNESLGNNRLDFVGE